MGFDKDSAWRVVLLELAWVGVTAGLGIGLMVAVMGDFVLWVPQIDIPLHDEYFVFDRATTLIYFVLWTAAWLYTGRAMWTRFVKRRINRGMLLVVGAHLLQLGYFATLTFFWLHSVARSSRIVTFLCWYNCLAIVFWVGVLIYAQYRIQRKKGQLVHTYHEDIVP